MPKRQKIISLQSEQPKNHDSDVLLHATEKDFELERFVKHCIENKLKGDAITDAMPDFKIKMSYRNAKRKIDAYRKNGLKGIIRKENKNKGEVYSFDDSVLLMLQDIFETKQVYERAYEDTHKWLRTFCVEFHTTGSDPKKYLIHEDHLCLVEGDAIIGHVTTEFVQGEYVNADGAVLPIGSLRSASRYLKDIKEENADELFVAKYGVEKYRIRRQHSIYLDYSNLLPNDLWSADNKIGDVLVIDWDWRTVRRPCLSGYIDASTRRYSCEVGWRPNSELVSNAFVVACNRWGLPKKINHDRGKDYLADRVQKLWSSLNIKTVKSISRNAKAKMIESFHNILDQKLKDVPGYTGNKYQEMPEDTKRMLKAYTKSSRMFKTIDKHVFDPDFKITLNSNLEGRLRASKKRFLHISEFIIVLKEALAEYHETLHGGLSKDKLGKKVYNRLCTDELIVKYGEKINQPLGRYNYHKQLGFIPVFAEPETLSVFAMNHQLRVVRLKGIELKKNHFFSPKLKKVLGKKVVVKFTNVDDRYIYVYTSPEIQKISSSKIFNKVAGADVFQNMKFVCYAERVGTYDYGDPAFTNQLAEQREEEATIQETIRVTQLSGFEANITEMRTETQEIIASDKKRKSQIKDIFDD